MLSVKKLIFLIYGLIGVINFSFSSNHYFLCGPDEDGCTKGNYEYCFCIPYNENEANNAHCLDFDKLMCTPLSQTPNCPTTFIYKNQSECLATIFQSSPSHPCKVKSYSFCMKEKTYICDEYGQLSSCHK